MVFKDSHYIELYKWRLRSETCGSSPEIRQQAAKRELDMRLEEISRRKKVQKTLIIMTYIVAAIFSLVQGLGLVAACLMHVAAFTYGKYCYIDRCEMYAYETALGQWEAEGKPSDPPPNKDGNTA